MEELLKMLTDASAFYVATVDGDKPKVRPFGFVMNYNRKLYFCTGNHKTVYRQLKANPAVEICAMISKDEWVRISGRAVFDENIEAKKQAFAVAPSLAAIYGSPESPNFELFYITNIEASVLKIDKEIRKIQV